MAKVKSVNCMYSNIYTTNATEIAYYFGSLIDQLSKILNFFYKIFKLMASPI